MNRVKKQLSLLTVVSTLALVFAGVAEAHETILTVDVDEASFIGPDAEEVGPFTVEGNTGSGVGTFQCWGWIIDKSGTAILSQVFFISGRGSIMTQGIEGGLLAVTGGTGAFSNVRGDAVQTFTGPGFDFTMEFSLKGAKL